MKTKEQILNFWKSRGWLTEKPAVPHSEDCYCVITQIEFINRRAYPFVRGEVWNHGGQWASFCNWWVVNPIEIDGEGFWGWYYDFCNPEIMEPGCLEDICRAAAARHDREKIPACVIYPAGQFDVTKPIFCCFWGFQEDVPEGWQVLSTSCI